MLNFKTHMFITSILVSIWLILFNRNYTFLFSIVFIFIFILEIYIDFIIISTYISLFWLRRNENESSREYTKLNIQLQNKIRRLMFLKIQNLFQKTNIISNNNNDNRYSLFDYRCPICLNNKQYSFRWIALGCGHILCSLCLQHIYFGNKPVCPNCRSSIILSDLTILYL